MRYIHDVDTNFVYISDKLKEFFGDFYVKLIKKFDEMGIEHGEIIGTKDIWCRDYMPIQIFEGQFVGYNYAPDYLDDKPAYEYIPRLSHILGRDVITNQRKVWQDNQFQYKLNDCHLILDGGNVVICDKYVVLTEKIFAENNCQSDEKKKKLLTTIQDYFDLEPVILPWKAVGEEVFGHSDGMIKYLKSNNESKPFVLISPFTKRERHDLFDALADKFYLDLISIPKDKLEPGYTNYVWAYINYLQVGNKILVPAVGMKSDEFVLERIKEFNPGCIVESIEMREIIECGGALHCITWNIKK